MIKVYRKTFKRGDQQFAGPVIVGEHEVQASKDAREGDHMSRAFFLTACLEAREWGTVQGYDGCGISGGPMHWVAVLPKGSQQGPLFKLVRRLQIHAAALSQARGFPIKPAELEDLEWELQLAGWHVARDGVLRETKTGKAVSGANIRKAFTPPNGNPGGRSTQDWKQTEKWARLFFQLLDAKWTWKAQEDHAIEYLIQGAKEEELRAYRYFQPKLESPETLHAEGVGESLACFANDIPLPVDFAMCVYHSYSPNAPGMAKISLQRFFKKYEAWLIKTAPKPTPLPGKVQKIDPNGWKFAQMLILELKQTKYGNWKRRYVRCRNYAQETGFWPENYFTDLMPE